MTHIFLEDVCGKVTCTENNPSISYDDYDDEKEDKEIKKMTKMNQSVINIYCCSPMQTNLVNRKGPTEKLKVQPKEKAVPRAL